MPETLTCDNPNKNILTEVVCNNSMYNVGGKKNEKTRHRTGIAAIGYDQQRHRSYAGRDCLLCRNCAIYNVECSGGISGAGVLCVIYGVSPRTRAEKCAKFRLLCDSFIDDPAKIDIKFNPHSGVRRAVDGPDA